MQRREMTSKGDRESLAFASSCYAQIVESMAACMVEKREAGYYVHGSRVPLDNLVYLWREGASNEYIQESYPTLEPDQVKGALQFYFANRFEVDSWIEDCERQESALLARMRTDPQYLRRVERLRGELELKP